MTEIYTGETDDDDPWDGTLYRETCNFVSDFGEDLIDWLQPEAGEWILDAGCGTGELTGKLDDRDCHVVGLDPSRDMLAEARDQFPDLNLVQADVCNGCFQPAFDAVFSNAALHWVTEPDRAIESIKQILGNHGRFVAEMGARGNIKTIRTAIHEELSKLGYNPEPLDPWYFPDPEQYVDKLTKHGFNVTHANAFERPTEMFGEEGLKLWLLMFAEPFFEPLNEGERQTLISTLVDRLRDELYNGQDWVLDYARLRFRAIYDPDE